MPCFNIVRVSYMENQTLGVLMQRREDAFEFEPFALTLERPWRDNRRNESCIPTGYYFAKRTLSPKFGDTFEVVNVPGRSHILFHTGNINDDTHGCIIVGEEFGKLHGKIAVLSSRRGFNEFMDRLAGVDHFALYVEGVTL